MSVEPLVAFRAQAFEEYVDVVAYEAVIDFQHRHVERDIEYPVALAAHEVAVRNTVGIVVSCGVRRDVDVVDKAFFDKQFQTTEHRGARQHRIVGDKM